MVVFIFSFSLFIALDYFLYLKNIIHRTHSINLNLLIFLQQHSNNTQTPFILSTHHIFFCLKLHTLFNLSSLLRPLIFTVQDQQNGGLYLVSF